MTWTYHSTLATDLDRVRFSVGDTDSTDPLLQDEEILWLITDEGNFRRAAVAAALEIAARYARKADYEIAREIRELASQKYTHYIALAAELRRKASRRGGTWLSGGLSISQKESRRDNADAVQPSFSVEQFDEPGAGSDGDSDDFIGGLPG